jgi:hypothetical protein
LDAGLLVALIPELGTIILGGGLPGIFSYGRRRMKGYDWRKEGSLSVASFHD